MILFSCDVCSAQLYFESTRCMQCQALLGYLPEDQTISVLQPGPDSKTFTVADAVVGTTSFKRCQNGEQYDACNWMVPTQSESKYCDSCALTQLIPDLSDPSNMKAWLTLEAAKRRLLFELYALGLPVEPKSPAQDGGLAFRFLRASPGQPVTTGHDEGIITLDVAEAEPAFREGVREQLGEQYRTPLGHLRHEIGHYYFDRLIAPSTLLGKFRELFGDERQDYEQCLERHYAQGPTPDWDQKFISAYASMHPWEDWAETWAHYLHRIDTLETASSYGLAVRPPSQNGHVEAVTTHRIDFDDFGAIMETFHPVALALNSLNRSMGLPDAYPFAIAPAAQDKLAFVHDVITQSRAPGSVRHP